MKKQKKITIKPFLNQKLEPECSDQDGKTLYPLYIQVTYDRKNTQIRSKYGTYYDDLNDTMLLNLKEFESKILYKVIEYETRDINRPYDLKGLKNKYDVYSMSIHIVMDDYLKWKLEKALQRTNSELMFVLKYEGFKCNFENLYKAAQLLFKNLAEFIPADFKQEIKAFTLLSKLQPLSRREYDFPTVIDWKDESFKSLFEKKLSKELNNKRAVTEMIKITDKIINDRLKNIIEKT